MHDSTPCIWTAIQESRVSTFERRRHAAETRVAKHSRSVKPAGAGTADASYVQNVRMWCLVGSSAVSRLRPRFPGPVAPWRKSSRRSETANEGSRIHIQGFCEFQNVVQGQVDLASFDLPDVRPMKGRAFGKRFLAKFQSVPPISDTSTEFAGRVGQGRLRGESGHGRTSLVSATYIQRLFI